MTRKQDVRGNAFAGASVGMAVGGAFAGLWGAFVGGVVGAVLGYRYVPEPIDPACLFCGGKKWSLTIEDHCSAKRSHVECDSCYARGPGVTRDEMNGDPNDWGYEKADAEAVRRWKRMPWRRIPKT